MAIFLAQPKCASTRFRSWVANATFIGLALPFAAVQLRRLHLQAGVGGPPRIRRRLVVLLAIANDEIGNVEDEVPRAAIADRDLMPSAQAIEHRKARAME